MKSNETVRHRVLECSLKCILAAEGELEDSEVRTATTASEGPKISSAVLRNPRRKIERLHSEDLRELLYRH